MRAEVAHLCAVWRSAPRTSVDADLVDAVAPPGVTATLDRFDRVQLEDVLRVCNRAPTLSAAGRILFDRSRERRAVANDADRLRKYLARFGLEWGALKERLRSAPADS